MHIYLISKGRGIDLDKISYWNFYKKPYIEKEKEYRLTGIRPPEYFLISIDIYMDGRSITLWDEEADKLYNALKEKFKIVEE